MAVTGVFQADYASFVTATQAAEVQLRSFESSGAKVEATLSRMTDAFSGRKVISEATLMAEVFQRAGGASQFTEAELRRMGATGAEAVAKMRALGIEIPPGIQAIADQARTTDKETNLLTTSVKNLAAGFIAMFSARAAFNFVQQTAAEASALADLSAQTRIGVEELQVMAHAVSGFGVTTDELARGVFNLSKRIAGGGDSVADALANMGMKLEDVRGLNGEQLFLTIQKGLATLQGSLRDTTAVELYGSKLGMSMAGAAEGTEGAIDAARRLNNIMSEDTVRALDEADEAIRRMSANLSSMAANMIGPVAQGFNVLIDASQRGASKWDIFVAMAKDLGASWDQGRESGTHLATLLDQLNQKTAATASTTATATTAARDFTPALDDQAGATKRAREEAAKLEAELKKLDASYEKLMSEVKNANQLALMEDEAAAMKQRAEQEAMFADQDIKARLRRQEAINAQAAAEAAAEEQRIAANQAEIDGLLAAGAAHAHAGSVAKASADQTIAGYQGVAQQITITGEAVREWINLMQYTAQANAILMGGSSLFTTQSQRERVAALGFPGANLPSAAPIGGGGGPQTFNNTFNIVDTESNIARRVGDNIMQQVRAGTQLS